MNKKPPYVKKKRFKIQSELSRRATLLEFR